MIRLFNNTVSIIAILSSCGDSSKQNNQALEKEKGFKTDNLYVYSFVPDEKLSIDNSKVLIEKFLKSKPNQNLYKSDENIVYFTDNDDINNTFEQDLSTGNISFNRGIKKYLGKYTPILPSKDESVKIAEDFLIKNKLFPDNKEEIKLVHVGGVRASEVIDGKKAGSIIDKMLTLTYGREIEGIPVIGSGSKIVIKIGDKGDILGLIRRWRSVNPQSKQALKEEDINSEETARALAKSQIIKEFGREATFEIKDYGKAYYDNNGKILQPVYAFETLVSLNDKKQEIPTIKYLCVIPIWKNSTEPLNLTSLPPRAKELLKNIKIGEKTSGGNKKSD